MSILGLEAFVMKYNTEEICTDTLFALKWKDGFVCSRCQCKEFYLIKTKTIKLFDCTNCHKQQSVIAGTFMEKTSIELKLWFRCIYILSNEPNIPNTELMNLLGINYRKSYTLMCNVKKSADNLLLKEMIQEFNKYSSVQKGACICRKSNASIIVQKGARI